MGCITGIGFVKTYFCIFLIYCCSVSTASAGDWIYQENKDKISDEITYVLGQVSEDGSGPLNRSPMLIVQCRTGKAVVAFNVGITGIADKFTIDYRFGSKKSQSVKGVGVGGDSIVIGGRSAIDFLDELGKNEKVFIRVNLPIAATSEGEFDLRNFSEHFSKISSYCKKS